MQDSKFIYATERMAIGSFDSSDALKAAIRKTVLEHEARHWEPYGIATTGAYITLRFRKAALIPRAVTSGYAGYWFLL